MRLGFYGGSFDPPHRAHLLVAQIACERFQLDRVLLVPVGHQPLKTRGASAPYTDRLAMTALLCEQDPSGKLVASDADAPQADGELNYTVETLERLRSALTRDDEIFVIAGADSFLDLRRWRDPERLLALAEWIVVSRPGLAEKDVDSLQLTAPQRQRVHWLDGVLDPVSATEVRGRLAAGEDGSGLVPEPILAYIRMHRLYGEPDERT